MDADTTVPPPSLRNARIALVHDWLNGRRGGEKCLEVLCEAFPNATIHTLLHAPGAAGPTIDGMRIKTSPLQQLPGVSRYYRALLPLMPAAARGWDVGEVDLVVSFSHCVAKSVRVPKGVPHVCYCFTPMRYAWSGRDAYLDKLPRLSPRRFLATKLLDRLRTWDQTTARGVTHFIAISETVRARIQACYHRSSALIYPPVDVDFYSQSTTARDDFYLVVSALVPYKRVDHAIQACESLGKPLVIIGDGPERARLESSAGATTRFLGWQDDAVLRDHFRRCRALLFPGEEDFGIVPVEALACGAPVIALGRGGVAESVNRDVGYLYDQPTIESLRAAILAWESQASSHDPSISRARALRFSRERFRNELLSFLAGVLRQNGDIPNFHLRPSIAPALNRRS